MRTVVRFRTGGGDYAVPVEHARGVRDATGLRTLPAPLPGVAGVLPGEAAALTVLDVLGCGGRHVLVLDPGGGEFGLLVDAVTAVSDVAEDAVGPAPAGQEGQLVSAVISVPGGLVLLVDPGVIAGRLAS